MQTEYDRNSISILSEAIKTLEKLKKVRKTKNPISLEYRLNKKNLNETRKIFFKEDFSLDQILKILKLFEGSDNYYSMEKEYVDSFVSNLRSKFYLIFEKAINNSLNEPVPSSREEINSLKMDMKDIFKFVFTSNQKTSGALGTLKKINKNTSSEDSDEIEKNIGKVLEIIKKYIFPAFIFEQENANMSDPYYEDVKFIKPEGLDEILWEKIERVLTKMLSKSLIFERDGLKY